MRRRALRLFLPLPLLLASGGCETGRRVYYAATHRIVRVPTGAMLPTIKPGDAAAVNEHYYSTHPVERFDMVTYRLPRENVPAGVTGIDENTQYLKRVVGLGGETLEIKGGRVYIDGRVLEEPFATAPLREQDAFGPLKIPEGEYFILGDNRQDSLDSRYWARPTLKKQYITGKVVEVFPQ